MPSSCSLSLSPLSSYGITTSKPSSIPNNLPPSPLHRNPKNTPSHALPRRLILPAASAIWDALTGGNPARDASAAVRRGMLLFRQGDVSGSLVEFDRAIELDPRQKAYLWQRGLSLYYLNRFEEGAEQFIMDVAANPNDTEESIWCFLCEAQLYGVEDARTRFLEVGRDSRPVMREAYNMFKDGGDPEKLVSNFLNGRENEYFYASLYAGLYHESQKDVDGAKLHILAACQSPYGSRSDDYMASLAKGLNREPAMSHQASAKKGGIMAYTDYITEADHFLLQHSLALQSLEEDFTLRWIKKSMKFGSFMFYARGLFFMYDADTVYQNWVKLRESAKSSFYIPMNKHLRSGRGSCRI